MIWERIKEIAEKQGKSITAIEKEAGLSNGLIGKWRESSPSVENLLAVAKVLNVSISELTDEK